MPSVMQMTSGIFGFGGFENGVRGEWRRNENHRSVCAGAVHRVGDGVEHRTLEMFGATFAGGNAADNVGTVLDHLLRVKGAFAAGKTLHDEFCFFVDQNAHK